MEAADQLVPLRLLARELRGDFGAALAAPSMACQSGRLECSSNASASRVAYESNLDKALNK
jgi:hypothetical protein